MSGVKRNIAGARKGHHLAGDLIALGSKPGGAKSSLRHSDDSKQRDSGVSSSGGPPSKKLKLPPGASEGGAGGLFSDPIRVSQVTQSQGAPQPSSSKTQPPSAAVGTTSAAGSGSKSSQPSGSSSSSSSSGTTSTFAQAIEVRPAELVPAVREAMASGGDSKATRMLCGALKQLKLSRLKPDATLNSALSTLVREAPELFSAPPVIEGLVAVLKREISVIFKKSSPSVYILTAQLLLLALEDSYDWPESVAKVFIEDSLGDRVWVDLDPCKKLVDNICTVFQTKTYSAGSGSGSGSGSSSMPASSSGSKTTFSVGDSGKSEGGEGGEGGDDWELSLDQIEVEPRFSPVVCRSVKAHVLQLVGDHFARGHTLPAADSVSRNLLKFLCSAMGCPELRLLVAQKVDTWIQNPKLGKQCQELLMTMATNCHAHSPEDVKVIEALIGIRLKTKLFSNQFSACIKELIASHPDNMETVLRGVVNNELGQLRSPSNIALISMMVHTWPENTAKLLGAVFQEFLTRKEDYLRALRGFLREVVRVVRNEFSFLSFARALMQERREAEFSQLEQTHKERLALSLADLVACVCMLSANMLIREAYNGYTKGEKAMVPQLLDFFTTLGVIQREAVCWVHAVVPGMFRPQPVDYKSCLRKVLFLEPSEAYTSRDNWPPETDRSLILRIMAEGCLKEDTIMRVLVIGLARELPLSASDALDMVDVLIARSANAHTEDIPRLPSIERKELFSIIFDVTAYRPPANIQLPEDYDSPSLAISKLYWKGWIILLVLSAFNPKTLGSVGWSDYPTLRGMMEMVMTNSYSFPTSMTVDSGGVMSGDEVEGGGGGGGRDATVLKELQLAREEKESILEYENHLASSSSQTAAISESNSFLLNQVTLLMPKGPARKLPSSVTDLVKTVNRTLKLGHLLCRCRSPDFLLEVIRRQGTVSAMKWLTELVESSHSSMEVLPVPCLCEFLMASYQEPSAVLPSEPEAPDPASHRTQYKRKKSAKDKAGLARERHKQLVLQLQTLSSGPQSTAQSCREVLEYFFEKLTSSQLTPRMLALKALKEIVTHSSAAKMASKSGEISEDTEDEDVSPALKSGEWLMSTLPSIHHFSAVLPNIYSLVLQACLVETSVSILIGYFHFLTQQAPHERLYESAIGLSQVIVDRFHVIRNLFLGTGDVGMSPATNMALSSLVELIRNAMEIALQSKTVPQLSSGESVLLNFPSGGQKAILHTTFIQATFLLLSLPPPKVHCPAFSFLMELWFPHHKEDSSSKQPLAQNIETQEKFSLPPQAITEHMLFAASAQVLEVVLLSASTSSLCQSLQEYGMPVTNVDMILARLDGLCRYRAASGGGRSEDDFRAAVGDPLELSHCIEIHALRGANNGQDFFRYLQTMAGLPEEHTQLPREGDSFTSLQVESVLPSSTLLLSAVQAHAVQPMTTEPLSKLAASQEHLAAVLKEMAGVPQEKFEQWLIQIFAPSLSRISAPADEVSQTVRDLEQWLKAVITSSLARPSSASLPIDTQVCGLIAALHKLVTGSSIRRQFLEGMVKHQFAISLFRLLTSVQALTSSENSTSAAAALFKSTLQHVLSALDAMKTKALKGWALFRVVTHSCAEQLGLRQAAADDLPKPSSRKIVKSTQKLIKEIISEGSMDPFENEMSKIAKICQELVQNNLKIVEELICVLAKRAIVLGRESVCVALFQRVRELTSTSNPPLSLQYHRKLVKQVDPDSDSEEEEDSDDDGNDDGDDVMGRGIVAMETDSPPVVASFSPGKKTLDVNGLFIDCQELLIPEILSHPPEATLQAVFGRSTPHPPLLLLPPSSSSQAAVPPSPSSPSPSPSSELLTGQGHLLARLTHGSSWDTLVEAVGSVLDGDGNGGWVNPSAVLDFLWACLHKPCLWQGRVKKEAVVNSNLSLGIEEEMQLSLTPPQLECLVGYILKEAAGTLTRDTRGLTDSSNADSTLKLMEISPEERMKLHSRIPLLMCCCHGIQKEPLETIVHYLQTNTSYPSLSWQLLVQLYHANERVILAVDHAHPLSVAALHTPTASKLDAELHYLMSAMAAAESGEESLLKMTSAALLCRKMAVQHPAIMLRQLPLLGWLLRGRAHFSPREFSQRNHREVFVNAFALLELLQPLVFTEPQTEGLNLCLESFFDFMKNHCVDGKREKTIAVRFADFLVQYAQHNRSKAAAVIQQNLGTLIALSEVYTSKKSSLKSLVDCFPTEGGSGPNSTTEPPSSVGGKMMLVPPLATGHSLSHEQVIPFLKKLENGQQREDILKVLQDLEETSLQHSDILKHFVHELCRIIQEPEFHSCSLAHNLLLRHLKQNPSSVAKIFPSYIRCLESNDHSVVMATMKSVPELVLLCRAVDARQLLGKVFSLATSSVHGWGSTEQLVRTVRACLEHTMK